MNMMPSRTRQPLLVSLSEAAQMLAMSKRTVYRMLEDGRLPAGVAVTLSGTLIRLKVAVLEQWVADNCPPASAPPVLGEMADVIQEMLRQSGPLSEEDIASATATRRGPRLRATLKAVAVEQGGLWQSRCR
jgi:excisionase family DNA binding protein